MTDDELEPLKGIHDPEVVDELRELADEAETEADAEAGEDERLGDHPEEHPDPSDPAHEHGLHELHLGGADHDGHDHEDHDHDHGHGHGHDDHPPESSSWVLLPLLVGAVIGIVLLLIFGLAAKAVPFV